MLGSEARMYQSNDDIQGAFLAAVHKLERIPYFWKLKEIRNQNLFSGKKKNMSNMKCTCPEESDNVLIVPVFFPLFPSGGQTCLGEYSVFPFFYLITVNESKAFPIIELLEVPILSKSLHFDRMEKEVIENNLMGFGKSYIVSQNKITNENLTDELFYVRKKVVSRVSSITSKSATIIFSAFSHLPKEIFNVDYLGYFSACENWNKNTTWPFQSEKKIPVINNRKVFLFTLSSWALGKFEVLE